MLVHEIACGEIQPDNGCEEYDDKYTDAPLPCNKRENRKRDDFDETESHLGRSIEKERISALLSFLLESGVVIA